jgi:hypothetical protein
MRVWRFDVATADVAGAGAVGTGAVGTGASGVGGLLPKDHLLGVSAALMLQQ